MKKNIPSALHRINRYLSMAGLGGRRDVEEKYILSGRVRVNGEVVKKLSQKVSTDDVVFVDEKKVFIPLSFSYYVLNKPHGFVVSRSTQKKQKTIYSILPKSLQTLRYAGRLDKNSRGLLVLSDDGDFIHSITHPRFATLKYYRVQLDKLITNISEQLCERGVMYESMLLRAVNVSVISKKRSTIDIVLQEGKKRHIRNMMKSLGIQVIDLYRYRVGTFSFDEFTVKEGQWLAVSKSYFFKKSNSTCHTK